MASPSPPNHQPDAHIAIVGWRQSNNGRCCSSHPTGCGQRWHNSGTAGAEFKLRRVVLPGEELALACYEVNADGSLGCHVAFAQKQYANAALIGIYHNATVKITAMYGMWSESKWERQMDKFNFAMLLLKLLISHKINGRTILHNCKCFFTGLSCKCNYLIARN